MARFEQGKIYEFIAHVQKLAAVSRGSYALLWKFNNYTVESKVATPKMDEGELGIVWDETLTMKIYFDNQMKDLISKIQIFSVDEDGNRRKKIGKVEFDLSKYLVQRKPQQLYMPVKRAKGKTLVFTLQSILPGQREKEVQKMIRLEEEALAREETKLTEEYNIVEIEQRQYQKQLDRMQTLIDRADKQATFRRQSKIAQNEIESLKKLISEVPVASVFNDEIQVKLSEKAALMDENHKLHIDLLEVEKKVANVRKAIRTKLHPPTPADPTNHLRKERRVVRSKVEQLRSTVDEQLREVEDLRRKLETLISVNSKRENNFDHTREELQEFREKLDELNHVAEKQTEDLHLARRRINVKGHHRRHKEFYRTKTITNTRRRLRNALSTQSELQAENELLLTRLVCMQSELQLQQERERRMIAMADSRREDEAAEFGEYSSRRSSMSYDERLMRLGSLTSAKERLSNLIQSEGAAGPRVPPTPRESIQIPSGGTTGGARRRSNLMAPITPRAVAMRAIGRAGTPRVARKSSMSTSSMKGPADALARGHERRGTNVSISVADSDASAGIDEPSFVSPLAPLSFARDRVNTLEPDRESNAGDIDDEDVPLTYSSTPSTERSRSVSMSFEQRHGHARTISTHSVFTSAMTSQMPDIAPSPRERELRKRYLSPIGSFTPESLSHEHFDFEDEVDVLRSARQAPVSVRRTAGAVCAFLEVNDIVADAESGVVKRFEKSEKLEKMLKSGRTLPPPATPTNAPSDNELSASRRSAPRSMSRTVASTAAGNEPSVTFSVTRAAPLPERKEAGTDNYLSLTGGPDAEGEMRGAHMLLDETDEVRMKYATKIRHLRTDLKLTQGYIEGERKAKAEIKENTAESRRELSELHAKAELLRQANAKLQTQVDHVEAERPDRLTRLTELRAARAERDAELQKEKLRELKMRIETLRSEQIALDSQASIQTLLPNEKVIDPDLIPEERGVLNYMAPDDDIEGFSDDDDMTALASLRSQSRGNVSHSGESDAQRGFRETQASISDLLQSLPIAGMVM